MQSIEVGIRELHRRTSRFIARVEEGAHLVVTRRGRPIGVVVPMESAAAWVLENRPLPPTWDDNEETWLAEGLVRMTPAAEDAADALDSQTKTRLVNKLNRLRRQVESGNVVVREGQAWALAAFAVNDPKVTLLAVGRRVELERRLRQPM